MNAPSLTNGARERLWKRFLFIYVSPSCFLVRIHGFRLVCPQEWTRIVEFLFPQHNSYSQTHGINGVGFKISLSIIYNLSTHWDRVKIIAQNYEYKDRTRLRSAEGRKDVSLTSFYYEKAEKLASFWFPVRYSICSSLQRQPNEERRINC